MDLAAAAEHAPRHVALVGLMGAGKSSVAAGLGARLGRPVVDLDEEIVAACGISIPEIFDVEGEGGFRRRELEALRAVLAAGEPCVVATGGGLVTAPEARTLLKREAVVVWLDVPVAVAAERVGDGDARPLLAGARPAEALARLHDAREPLYREVADLVVDAGMPLEAVLDAVVAGLEGSD